MSKYLINALFLLMMSSSLVYSAVVDAEKALDGMTTFEASFTQQVTTEQSVSPEASSGKVWIQRPGRFFWKYSDGPHRMDIIADGVNLWIYQPSLKQVMVQSLADISEDLPISWLASDQPISARYKIKPLEDSMTGLKRVDLQNKRGGTNEIAFIELALLGDVLKEVKLISSDGKVTLVVFHGVKKNQAIDPEKFVFRPAPDIDIIGTPH